MGIKLGMPTSSLPVPVVIAFWAEVIPQNWKQLIHEVEKHKAHWQEIVSYPPRSNPIFEEIRCIWKWILPCQSRNFDHVKAQVKHLKEREVQDGHILILPVKQNPKESHAYRRKVFKTLGCAVGSGLDQQLSTNVIWQCIARYAY